MTDQTTDDMASGRARWSQLTYSSFGKNYRRGWGIGPELGASEQEEKLFKNFVRSSLTPVEEVTEFLSQKQIDELPVRFEYIPVHGHGVYMQCAPAGKDPSGRMGNTFTHCFVNGDTYEPTILEFPIQAYRSASFKRPFHTESVDNVQLGEMPEGPEANPAFDIELSWAVIREMGVDRIGVVYKVLDAMVLDSRLPVLLVKNSNDIFTWLTVISTTMESSEAHQFFRFSTYERAHQLNVETFENTNVRGLILAPFEDKSTLERNNKVLVIDPTDPATGYTPQSQWAADLEWALDKWGSGPKVADALRTVPRVGPGAYLGKSLRKLHDNDAIHKIKSEGTKLW